MTSSASTDHLLRLWRFGSPHVFLWTSPSLFQIHLCAFSLVDFSISSLLRSSVSNPSFFASVPALCPLLPTVHALPPRSSFAVRDVPCDSWDSAETSFLSSLDTASFPLEDGPLWHLEVIRCIAENRTALVFAFNHAITDQLSFHVLLNDILDR